jgi:hypothetical protein
VFSNPVCSFENIERGKLENALPSKWVPFPITAD